MLCQAALVSTWLSNQEGFVGNGPQEGSWGEAKEPVKHKGWMFSALWEGKGERMGVRDQQENECSGLSFRWRGWWEHPWWLQFLLKDQLWQCCVLCTKTVFGAFDPGSSLASLCSQSQCQRTWSRQVSDQAACVSVVLLSCSWHGPTKRTLQILPLQSLEGLVWLSALCCSGLFSSWEGLSWCLWLKVHDTLLPDLQPARFFLH